MQCKACNSLKRLADIISDSLKMLRNKVKGNVSVTLPCHFLGVTMYIVGYDVNPYNRTDYCKVTNTNNCDRFWNDTKANLFAETLTL